MKIEIKLERIKDEKKNELASVKIGDNGKGIDSEIMTRLFKKFATEPEFGGTGLGLYISKNIVESHRGTIRGYNNNDGKVLLLNLHFYYKKINHFFNLFN
jgi:signal transduction histidine kinase